MRILTLADLQEARDLFWKKSFNGNGVLLKPIQKRGVVADLMVRAGGTLTFWPVLLDKAGNEVVRDEYAVKGCKNIFEKYLRIYPYTLENRLFWEDANEREIWNHVIPMHSPWMPRAFKTLYAYFKKRKRGLIYMVGANIGKHHRVAITINPYFVPDPDIGLTALEIVKGNRGKRTGEEARAHLSVAPFLEATIPETSERLVRRIGSVCREVEEEWAQ